MRTEIISTAASDALARALRTLKEGGIVAFPTDTVYGLGAAVGNDAAIIRLFEAKGRDFNKAIAVLVESEDQAGLVAAKISPAAKRLMDAHWPGALTVVVEKRADLPAVLTQSETVGIRMPRHDFALALLRLAGPLATTSANLSGGENPLTADDVMQQLDERIDLILDGGRCPGGVPSTVVDCTRETPVILRQGAISDLAF